MLFTRGCMPELVSDYARTVQARAAPQFCWCAAHEAATHLCPDFHIHAHVVHALHAGGQVLSAVVGCTVHLVLGRWVWLSGAVGMSLSLVVMMLTKTTHPVR